MVIYSSSWIYVNGGIDMRDKITRLDNIITALEMLAASNTNIAQIQEYDLDTGQSKVKMQYRSLSDVANAIKTFETLKQQWINRLNGRKFKLVDSKNFIGPWPL